MLNDETFAKLSAAASKLEISQVPDGCFTAAEFAARLAITPGNARKRLERLAEAGFVEFVQGKVAVSTGGRQKYWRYVEKADDSK